MAVVAPMPRVRAMTATAVTAGFFHNIRRPYLKSWIKLCIGHPALELPFVGAGLLPARPTATRTATTAESKNSTHVAARPAARCDSHARLESDTRSKPTPAGARTPLQMRARPAPELHKALFALHAPRGKPRRIRLDRRSPPVPSLPSSPAG